MKRSYFSVINRILLFTVVFLSACAGFGGEETAVLPPTPTIASPTSVPTETATQTPTETVTFQSESFVPLSIEEEGLLLNRLMTTNGGCELPCWWGITPGKTTEKSANENFIKWGIHQWYPSDSYRLVNIGYSYPDTSNYISDTSMKFWVENDTINYIQVSVQQPKQGVETEFYRDWALYQVDEILDRFGMPQYIGVLEGIPNAGGKSYVVTLSYPDLGVEISYVIGSDLLNNGKHQICFEFPKFKFIVLDLFQPEWIENVPEFVIPNHLEDYTSLESVTGLTVEAFYKMYINTDDFPCILID